MPTLLETVEANKIARFGIKLSRCKPVNAMNISASITLKKSEEFHLVKARVSKVPLLFAFGAPEDGPLIIDRNFAQIGKLNSGFIPSVIVLSGKNTLLKAKKAGEISCSAWVGSKAIKSLSIMAADSLSNSDIEQKLTQLIQTTYPPKKPTSSKVLSSSPYDAEYGSYPYIRDVYQGDGYCIFRQGKAYWKQSFVVNTTTRNVTLSGDRVEVFQTYQPAPTGDVSSASDNSLTSYIGPDPNAPAKGGFNGPASSMFTVDMINFGAPNSELNNPQLKLMLNIEDALDQYLALLKTGIHKPVAVAGLKTLPAYVNAARETVIALNARKDAPSTFSLMDFMKWQDKRMNLNAAAQTKNVNGETLTANDFAYVGDPRDISTWHLPIASKSHVLSSLRAASEASAIPKFERQEVREKLRTLASEFGITASDLKKKTKR